MNFQASGRCDEILGQIDSKLATDNEEQQKFKDRLKDFVDGVCKIYGNASQVNVFSDGVIDHGGASFGLQFTLLNYNDPDLPAQGDADVQTEPPKS